MTWPGNVGRNDLLDRREKQRIEEGEAEISKVMKAGRKTVGAQLSSLQNEVYLTAPAFVGLELERAGSGNARGHPAPKRHNEHPAPGIARHLCPILSTIYPSMHLS